jgi:WD40 repeat protein
MPEDLTERTVAVLHDGSDPATARTVQSGLRLVCPRDRRPRVILSQDPGEVAPLPTVALLSPRLRAAIDDADRDAPAVTVLGVVRGDIGGWSDAGLPLSGPDTAAFPERWRPGFPREPRYVDLTWLPAARHPRRNPKFRNDMADLVGPAIGLSKEELVRAEARRLVRVRTALTAAVIVALLAVAVTLTLTGRAVSARDTAVTQQRAALGSATAYAAGQVVVADPALGFLVAKQVLDQDPGQVYAGVVMREAVGLFDSTTVLARPKTDQICGVQARPSDGAVLVAYCSGTVSALLPGGAARVLSREPALREPAILPPVAGAFPVISLATGSVRLADPSLRTLATVPVRLPSTARAAGWATTLGLIVTGNSDGTVAAWDVRTGRPAWSIRTGGAAVAALAVDAAGDRAAVSTQDGSVELLSLHRTSADVIARLRSAVYEPSAMTFAADGTRLVVGTRFGAVAFFTTSPLAAQGPPVVSGGSGMIWDLTPCRGNLVLAAATDSVALYDTVSRQVIDRFGTFDGSGLFVRPVDDGWIYATVDGFIYRRPVSPQAAVPELGIKLATGQVLRGRPARGATLAFSQAGFLSVLSLPSLTRSAATIAVSTATAVNTSAVDHDAATVFLTQPAGQITRWNSRTGTSTLTDVPGGEALTSLSRQPAGNLLLGSTPTHLDTWRVEKNQLVLVHTFPVQVSGALTPVWLDSGHVVYLSGDQASVAVVDPVAGRVRLIPVTPGITALAVSPNGRQLAVGTGNGEVITVDSHSGAVAHVTVQSGAVSALAYLDQGDIAFGLTSGSVLITRTSGRTWPVQLGLQSGAIVSITPLPGRVITSDSSTQVLSWDFDFAAIAAKGCRLFGRAFTASEAQRFGVPAHTNPCRPVTR